LKSSRNDFTGLTADNKKAGYDPAINEITKMREARIITDLRLRSEVIERGNLVSKVNTGMRNRQRQIAITNAEQVIVNDSQRNCIVRFEFVAPATFLNPASLPLRV
jgi:hypothetical protein